MNKQSIYKITAALLICISLIAALSSCSSLLSTLGFDTHNYEAEEVIAEHDSQSEVTQKLVKMTKMLCVNSPILTEFDGTTKAVDACRDSILNYMLCEGYSKYTGDIALLDRIAEKYPQYNITVAIPSTDFESVVYENFGGGIRITNKNGSIFTYLDKVNAYTTSITPQADEVETVVLKCEETENTYRMEFYNTLNDISSEVYETMLIKREDGSCYFSYVRIRGNG